MRARELFRIAGNFKLQLTTPHKEKRYLHFNGVGVVPLGVDGAALLFYRNDSFSGAVNTTGSFLLHTARKPDSINTGDKQCALIGFC